MHGELMSETLSWCNARRQELGKKPLQSMPQGKRMDPDSCPCGAATGLAVGSRVYWKRGDNLTEDRSVALPQAVRQFVSAFDAGAYPDLVLGGWPDDIDG